MSAKSARPNPCRDHEDWRLFLGAGVAALILALGMAPESHACDLALNQGPGTVVIDYNPFAIGPSAGALDLGFTNQGDEQCDLRLSFTDEGGTAVSSLALGGVGVQFRPRESSGLQASDIEPGVFRFTLAGRATAQAQMDAAVVVEAVPEAGTYVGDLRLVVKDPDDKILLAPIPVRVQLVSTPRAQLNVAGAAGAFGSGSSVEVVDFGEAATGAVRRIFLQVRANAPSTLSIVSEHGGVMRRQGDVATESHVPYAVELDAAPVDLSTPWSRPIDPPRTLAGASLPMIFTMGTVRGQMAGRYQDVITIDISPN